MARSMANARPVAAAAAGPVVSLRVQDRVVVVLAVVAALLLAATPAPAAAQNLPVPPLKYDYGALEPSVPEATLRVHHLGHHAAYTKKLNAALARLRGDAQHKHLAKLGIDTLLTRLGEVPDDVKGAVRNSGGGYVNHQLYFESMTPGGSSLPAEDSPLGSKMVAAFGSVDAGRQALRGAAAQVFGSGYAWLVYSRSAGTVSVTTSANQDTPASDPDIVPLMVIDVWEHAYYLDHTYQRGDYLDAFFDVANWPEAEARLADAVAGAGGDAEL